LQATEADEKDIKGIYWGYKVNAVPSLLTLLKRINDSEIVITSRKGACLSSIERKFVERIKSTQRLLVIFGSPQRGIPEMLTRTGYDKDKYGFMINMFPFQGTATVRLEEAMLGTLAIVNYIVNR
jgi:predicted SPOUT superfamily RNA methylase MTH1